VRELVLTFVKGLVDEPSRVSVRERRENGVCQFDLLVAPADRGRVIGRRGRTVGALRTLLGAVAERRGERCRIEVLE
jgi:predicted RNA-binding protein YlqC (UPF0109 family)